MTSPNDPQNPAGGQMPPGSGYIPPGSAVTFNGLSAATSSPAVVVLMTLGWSTNTVGESRVALEGGLPHNPPLAVGLVTVAIVFAAVALLITALSERYEEHQPRYRVLTPKKLLWAWVALTLAG